MSGCVEKLPHSCGSSDGLQVFQSEGGFNGYCFSCRTFVADPYGHGGAAPEGLAKRTWKSPEQVEAELQEIDGLGAHDLPERKLNKASLEHFGIRIGLSEEDGATPAFHYYPYYKNGKRSGYKVRLIEGKRMWFVGDMEGTDLFGWEQAVTTGAKRLYITEGEPDAVALLQALKQKQAGTQWAGFDPAVVSLSRGAAGAKKDITAHLTEIRAKFKEVVLVFDNDDAGRKATQDVLTLLPTARTVSIPGKDANDCVVQGRSLALCNAVLFQSQTPKNTRLVWGQSLYDAGREQAQWGLSWPWQALTKHTRGIRFGETYYLGAGVKMGKSELVNSIAAHLMLEHNLKVFLAKPEEANRKTIQMVLGKVAGRIFHDPEVPFDFEAYDAASQRVGNRLCLLSLYQHLGWESLRADIMVAAEAGCKAVFIDPITNLVNGVTSGETNTLLQEIAQELAALAKDLDIVVFIFCHLKAPENGPAHERGGKVMSYQFSGSRAMMRSCNLMLGLEGDKDPDKPEEQRNMRRLVILEDREFGATGVVNLYWDARTSLFNELPQ